MASCDSSALLSHYLLYLSVSKRDSTGREPCGTETREREDSNKEVREKKEGGEKTPTDSFFLLITDFYYYFDWIKILSFAFFILFDIWTKNVFLPF